MTQSNIDLGAFIDLLDGQVDEGDNSTFYLDESGIRAIVPDVSERQSIGLFSAEKKALRQFEKDCELIFPCTIEDVRQWVKRTGEADMPDGLAEPVEPQIEAPQVDAQPEQAAEPQTAPKKRGRKPTIPDEARSYYNELIAAGEKQHAAARQTVEHFSLRVKPDSLRRRADPSPDKLPQAGQITGNRTN